MWTNNPVADAERYAAEHEKHGRRCQHCDTVLDGYAYDIAGVILCEDCVNEIYRFIVDDEE